MPVLVDGYNLLFAAGFVQHEIGELALERARQTLLRFLARHLEPHELAATTIVFDAKNPPANRPDQYELHGLTVIFARDHEEADDLLLEMVRKSSVPQQIVLVSSDSRLQQLASRRRVRTVTSDSWLEELEQRGERSPERARAHARQETKPLSHDQLSQADVAKWLEIFAIPADLVATGEPPNDAPEPPTAKPTPPAAPPPGPTKAPADTTATDTAATDPAAWDPFPPGYGEDLLDDPPL